MSTTSQHYLLPARTKAKRLRIRDAHRRPRLRTAEGSGVTPVMAPANPTSGVSVMGASTRAGHPHVMGGPDAGPRVTIMGAGDHGARIHLFGHSELRLVDALFTSARNDGQDRRES
jgi:hypothetical protein